MLDSRDATISNSMVWGCTGCARPIRSDEAAAVPLVSKAPPVVRSSTDERVPVYQTTKVPVMSGIAMS